MRIALDAMGGDRAPADLVRGAVQAAAALADVEVVLVGDAELIGRELGACNGSRARVSVEHCTEVIGMEESPVTSLRRKLNSSISRCWQLAAQGQVEAIVSAGNTGAVVAGSAFGAHYLPGVRRPGIAVAFPVPGNRRCVLMDVGANMKCKPVHLVQYAIMASVYAERILGVDNPRVGLLSVGEEEGKGNELTKETAPLLSRSPVNFVGNVEGRDIHSGACDVIICDGFVGNVVLKVTESLVSQFMKTFDHAVMEQQLPTHFPVETERLRQALDTLWGKYDYTEYGGAPLLGIDQICIICHGSSNARAIRNAIRVAHDFSRFRINAHLVAQLQAAMPLVNAASATPAEALPRPPVGASEA